MSKKIKKLKVDHSSEVARRSDSANGLNPSCSAVTRSLKFSSDQRMISSSITATMRSSSSGRAWHCCTAMVKKRKNSADNVNCISTYIASEYTTQSCSVFKRSINPSTRLRCRSRTMVATISSRTCSSFLTVPESCRSST